MAARDVLKELATRFTQAGGAPVDARAAGGVDVAKRVRAGEDVDVVVLASNVIDELIAEGHLAGTRVDLVRSGVGIAAPSGRARPAVATEQEVRAAVLAARTVSFSTGPSGTYLQKLFERWGIFAAVKERIIVPSPGVPVGSLVAEGRAELGFQQLSELINVAGVEVLGPLPESIQSMTLFSGGVAKTSANPSSARALLESMTAPATAPVKQRFGMEAVA
ncbi:MAG: substrate-binding domain-containing protein [Casimicrobiaceae bacterium]